MPPSHRKLGLSDLKDLPDWELLTFLGRPGQVQRYHEWRSHMSETHFLQPGEDYLVDLDHHP